MTKLDESEAEAGAEPEGARRRWKQDPATVQADILDAARALFARKGYSGARVEEIAASTSYSKRMIYYYFGDKEGLWRAVLAEAYRRTREAEEALDLRGVPPVEALRRLAEFTFENHAARRDFIRLVMIENVHEGAHMPDADEMAGPNLSVIRLLADIYERGLAAGLFRPGLTPLELHWQISALSYFNVANRATFSRIFGDALFTPDGQDRLKRQVGEALLRFVLTPEALARELGD
ncbi:TetR/AcrR family transcriptional regulator [Albimonas sp. CAU 1670]|uniref:TetR/AcrR family transcriptional regulator n=1 Tax=Albimonas sp. CAU 1670 TaxID=3032599 RepID=UPI0023DBE591|nr:TetR/AcrR family transcriptional regulator [Albimonas sp. CAU 1670]MDF2235350.1 TetR/AcrR family transcriptional regulator [Albimonas sp. CAU 1670]